MFNELSSVFLRKIYNEQHKPNPDMSKLRASKLGWNMERFSMVIDVLRINGYITDILVHDEKTYCDTSLDNVKITPSGIAHLKALGMIE